MHQGGKLCQKYSFTMNKYKNISCKINQRFLFFSVNKKAKDFKLFSFDFHHLLPTWIRVNSTGAAGWRLTNQSAPRRSSQGNKSCKSACARARAEARDAVQGKRQDDTAYFLQTSRPRYSHLYGQTFKGKEIFIFCYGIYRMNDKENEFTVICL